MKKLIVTCITLMFLTTCIITTSAYTQHNTNKIVKQNNQATLIINVKGGLFTTLKEKAKVTAQLCTSDPPIPYGEIYELSYADPVPGCECAGHYITNLTAGIVMIYVYAQGYETIGPLYYTIESGCNIKTIIMTKNLSITKSTNLVYCLSLFNQIRNIYLRAINQL